MAKKNIYFNCEGFKVANVRKLDFGTFFTLKFEGLALYNLRVVPAGKNYDAFVAMPQVKGSDRNYYDEYKIYLSDEDNAAIIAAVDDILDEQFEEEKKAGRKARK